MTFNACLSCGAYRVDKRIDAGAADEAVAICPVCGRGEPLLRLPLFLVTGASGTGKSTLALHLARRLRGEAVVLDTDILWREEFATPEDEYRSYRDLWLRMAKNIAQSGLPVLLAGTSMPSQFANLLERRYFSALHVLGLIADAAEIRRRLVARPTWRESASTSFISDMLRFNEWLRANGQAESIELLDTGELDVEACVTAAVTWFRIRRAATGDLSVRP